jgi:hypothetical protein
MEINRRICLYGNSVILGSLGSSLRRYPQIEVTTLVPPLPGAPELATLEPDVVLFDLQAAHNEAVFSLLESHPQLLLIGISPDTNLVKMWASQQLQELSTQDLLEVINKQLKDLSAVLND